MECPYCKEEIKQGAQKCKFCGEILGSKRRFKNVTSVLTGLLSILIPIGSLSIAYLEHQGRVQADRAKEEAQLEKKATQDILDEVPPQIISSAIKKVSNVSESLGYDYLKKDDPKKAIVEFKKTLERNPEDEAARKGIIYAETLAKKKTR